ncbi:MAG TPA: hypothetical protein VMM35_02230 [Longimicrobiales bacterium]|nr:hypothetical protein [Longimicrobiales bacterium]
MTVLRLRSRAMLRRTLLLTAFAALSVAPAARAQTLSELTRTPESTADAFLRSVRAIRWEPTGRLLHPQTSDRFRTLVSMIAQADTTGEARRYLTGTDAAGFSALGDAEVFARAIGAMIDDMPGLMHALYDRDDEVVGHVAEGTDSAHVVYRTLARIGGAVPEVKIMQLARADDGWRILWSDELGVLDAALRGVRTGRR